MKMLRLATVCTIIAASAAVAGSREWPKYKEPEPIVKTAWRYKNPAAGQQTLQHDGRAKALIWKCRKAQDTLPPRLNEYLDTILNSSSQAEVGRALDVIVGPSYAGSSGAADSLIYEALARRIPKYGKSWDIALLDDLSKTNLCKALIVLRVTFGNLTQQALENAVALITPLLDRGTHDASADICETAAACVGWGARVATYDRYSISKGVCDSAISKLLGTMDKAPAVCEALALICENREGDLGTLDQLLQKYKALMFTGFTGDPEREAFIRIYAVVPDAVGSIEAVKIAERWMCYPWDRRSTSPWLALLAKIMAVDSITPEQAAEKIAQVHRSLQEGDPAKAGLGMTTVLWCQKNRTSQRYMELMSLAGMDSGAISLVESIPLNNMLTPNAFYVLSCLAQADRTKPVSEILDTLVRHTRINMRMVGQYPRDIITHLYLDRNRASEKPVMFTVFTTRTGGFPFGELFEAFDYGKFDIRIIEPGSDTVLVSMMKEMSGRLGKPFRYLAVSGHGDWNHVLLRPGGEYLDLGDTVLLKEMKSVMVPGADIILDACMTAQGSYNLGKFVAETMEARCFGADTICGGIRAITFDAKLEIVKVAYYGANAKVYDCRPINGFETGPVWTRPETSVSQTGATFRISIAWSQPTAECDIYDMAGRFIANLRPDDRRVFVWNADGTAAGIYLARIRDSGKSITLKLNKN